MFGGTVVQLGTQYGAAGSFPTAPTAPPTACSNQANAQRILNDLNTAIRGGKWPFVLNKYGYPEPDLSGNVFDFRVISDNGGLLDCTLLIWRERIESQEIETIRIRYGNNIAGQPLYNIWVLEGGTPSWPHDCP